LFEIRQYRSAEGYSTYETVSRIDLVDWLQMSAGFGATFPPDSSPIFCLVWRHISTRFGANSMSVWRQISAWFGTNFPPCFGANCPQVWRQIS